jgi:hypothetical protein
VCFTRPSFHNFGLLVLGWIVCQGRRSVSRVIQACAPLGERKHFSSFYRFLSRARWCSDALGEVLWRWFLPYVESTPVLLVDDTLCHRSGPHLFGGGMFHDAARSTYGRGTAAGARAQFAFGHNWVVLSVYVPWPWNRSRGWAIPLLFRLYRSKKLCPSALYRKRTQLALDMLRRVRVWIPAPQRMVVVGDGEYACRTILRHLPADVAFVGRMADRAALFGLVEHQGGRGRPRLRGARLKSPRDSANDSAVRWQQRRVSMYGHQIEVDIKEQVCLWYTVAHTQPLRVVVTKDLRRTNEVRAFFSSDPTMLPEEILRIVSLRWKIEVSFRDAKQCLGLEDPQNGWWRRRRRAKTRLRPGPQPNGRRGEQAVLHTFPLIFLTYALVILWYLRHGNPRADVARVREGSPWYQHKREPSFADMLYQARRSVWANVFCSDPLFHRMRQKLRRMVQRFLWAA